MFITGPTAGFPGNLATSSHYYFVSLFRMVYCRGRREPFATTCGVYIALLRYL